MRAFRALLALLLASAVHAQTRVLPRAAGAGGVAALPVLASPPVVPTGDGLSLAPASPLADLRLPVPAPARSLVEKDPRTGLYGVSAEQLRTVVEVLRRCYGENLIDLAVIGSRARGVAGGMKHGRPVRERSDLDLVPVLARDPHGAAPAGREIEEVLERLLGMPVQMHSVLAFDGRPDPYGVPFYGAGTDEFFTYGSGNAVQVPLSGV